MTLNFPLAGTSEAVAFNTDSLLSEQKPLTPHLLASERDFYDGYDWSLNTYPTLEKAILHLRQELSRLDQCSEEWHLRERMLNVYLLACAITNEVDDFLVGTRYDFSKAKRIPLLGGIFVRGFDRAHGYVRKNRERRLRRVSQWNRRWLEALDQFLQIFVNDANPDAQQLENSGNQLAKLLDQNLPEGLKRRRLRNPAFFHVRDLTHFDILKMGDKFIANFPDRTQRIVLVGLRTAGSYFNPLLRAYLKVNGYADVESLTIRPRSVVGWAETAQIAACAKAGRLAVIMDEPPISGGSTAGVARILYKAGFPKNKVAALFPVFYLYPEWKKGWGNLLDSGTRVFALEPKEWHKTELLECPAALNAIKGYFTDRGYTSVSLRTPGAENFNKELQYFSEQKMHTRLKRVYEVQLRTRTGETETRYVLAKSVGWGWLGYRAFLLGKRLSQFVPPVLGMRDGVIYTEWLPQTSPVADQALNGHSAQLASYVANRVRWARLEDDPSADLIRDNQHKGYEELAGLLGHAYGSSMASALKRPRIQQRLSENRCPVPTVIDAKMRPQEWIGDSSSLLKTDFEHHAMGKRELEMVDPAYDLAEASLHFNLSEGEEQKLIARYVEESGDANVGDRLFLNKLLAGTWSMIHAQLNLNDKRLTHRMKDFNQQYLQAWQFLTLQTARHCGRQCVRPQSRRWQSPLVVLDVDGVLDRNVFSAFPSITGAGMQAVSLLHSHGLAVTLDSARSLYEVKQYCEAYGFVGGVAEYGSSIWDAVNQQERVLVSPEALSQLDTLRSALRKIPGVFLNDTYQHSIRAFSYGRERTAALPTLMISGIIGEMKLDRLRFHQTEIDTAVLAHDINKGTGLKALVNHANLPNAETIAVGDSEPDLDMFGVATRSYAPSQIGCADKAAKLGCKISSKPYQMGLLEIARSIVHPDGKRCARCEAVDGGDRKQADLFMELLQVADRKRIPLLIEAVLDPMAVRAFVK
jgi:HAD superfamily hydrolase (TIGR01484 family)